jgi:hypothetical protein
VPPEDVLPDEQPAVTPTSSATAIERLMHATVTGQATSGIPRSG